MRAETVPPFRAVDQHTGQVVVSDLDPSIGSTLPESDRDQFRGRAAAAKSVAAWIDLDPGRALVGCTPSMVSQVAVDAYLRMGGGSASDAEGLRVELDATMSQLRALGSMVASLTASNAMWHAERDEQRERGDEYQDQLSDALATIDELRSELADLKAGR